MYDLIGYFRTKRPMIIYFATFTGNAIDSYLVNLEQEDQWSYICYYYLWCIG